MSIKFLNSCYWMALLLACLVISCRKEEKEQPDYVNDPFYNVAINFSTIGAGNGTSSVTEKIKTFRIIITSCETPEEEPESNSGLESLQSNEIVELNKFVTEENLAYSFNFYLLWQTAKGKKNFYLFANEESVGGLNYSNGNSGETNLSSLLNSYTVGDDASELKSILTSAYFTPEYNIDTSGNIYLPYTSIYEGIEVKTNNESYRMYLVPVATKFIFNFVNYRPAGVFINGISINSTNTDNYLFANIGDSNKQMTLPGESTSLYWVDWLAKVSELSHGSYGYSPNQSFNNTYGWIWDYSIPTSEVNSPYEFVAAATPLQISGISYPENDDNGEGDEEGEEVEGIPGKYTAGPFYVPESRVNVEEQQTSKGKIEFQRYSLTIGLADSNPDNKDVPEFSDVEIDNLKALFRNTTVIINMVMRQGDVEIYAEIEPWAEQQSFGYVNEGNKPNFMSKASGL